MKTIIIRGWRPKDHSWAVIYIDNINKTITEMLLYDSRLDRLGIFFSTVLKSFNLLSKKYYVEKRDRYIIIFVCKWPDVPPRGRAAWTERRYDSLECDRCTIGKSAYLVPITKVYIQKYIILNITQVMGKINW